MKGSTLHLALSGHRLTRPLFKGVKAANRVPTEPQRQQGVYVVNTHTDREPGEHWVVLFFQRDSLYYFDSYGLPLHPNIAAHLQTRKRIFYNPTRLQGNRATCGNYCLYHVLSLVHPYHSMNTFGSNLAANDRLVLHLTGHFFNV